MSRQFLSRFVVSGFLLLCGSVLPLWKCKVSWCQSPPPSTILDRFPPLTVQQAEQSFEIADGYRIELVAAEPLVVDPVAFCFDARGRLLVVEMRGYSERPDDHMGRLRRLTDTDGDGRMDAEETLAEGLSWPTAVECWNDGIVVATAPDLLYFSEDGSQRKILCSGFGKSNVQGLVNSLRYGLDLNLHGATSSSGAEILGLGHDTPLRLGGRDFAIDTWTEQLRAVDGGGQHGMMIDAWGDKYVCSNSDHLQQVIMLDARPYRSNQLSTEVARRRSIASDGPQAEVYRASPVEPWRILRTHLRVTGQASGPIEGGGRAAGYFTGATGIWVYEDDQWPAAKHPIALVCDVGSNLIHRKFLNPQGLMNVGVRIDQQTEFLRSTDTWFRPVQLGCGPDGALYIADMYREVIEHPKSLPPVIKSQVDLNSGNDKGRIWRIVAKNRPLRRKHPNLEGSSSAELVELLDCKNAWQRRTAARLLLHREDAVTCLEDLCKKSTTGQFPEGRLQALMTLNAIQNHLLSERTTQDSKTNSLHELDALVAKTLEAALRDPHERIRQAAIQLTAMNRALHSTVGSPTEEKALSTLTTDPSIHVRFQLALEAAILFPDVDRRGQVLQQIFNQDASDPYLLWAIEGSLLDSTGEFLKLLLASSSQDHPENKQLASALRITLFQMLRQEPSDAANASMKTLIQLLERPINDSSDALWSAVAEAVERAKLDGGNARLAEWIRQTVVPDLASNLESAVQAGSGASPVFRYQMAMVRWADPEAAIGMLSKHLSASQPPWLQQTAIQSLAGFDAASVDTISLALNGLSPSAQQTAIEKLASSETGRKKLLERILDGSMSINALPQQIVLEWKADKAIAAKLVAAGVRGYGSVSQQAVDQRLAVYLEQLDEPGDATLGLSVFSKHCAACHKPADNGQLVGPELKSVREKSAEQILISILDPNREVDPKYRAAKVLTNYGKLITGILTQETDSQMTLVDNQGQKHSVERIDIESFETTSKSLMPEGLSDNISPEEMQHLITYLRTGEVD